MYFQVSTGPYNMPLMTTAK